PIADLAGGDRLGESVAVHPGDHQHLAGIVLLGDRPDEAGGIEGKGGEQRRRDGAFRRNHRAAERVIVLIGPRFLPESAAILASCASIKAFAGSSPSSPPSS